MEVWKDIQGFAGRYQISSDGRVRFVPTGQIRTNQLDATGYWRVSLKYKKEGKTIFTSQLIHRLIAIAFIPNPENKPHINHKNRNRADCRIENLEWCTPKENCQHSVRVGGNRSKEFSKRSGVTPEQVKEILLLKGKQKVMKTAKEFGVSRQIVYGIHHGITYNSLTGLVKKLYGKKSIGRISPIPNQLPEILLKKSA